MKYKIKSEEINSSFRSILRISIPMVLSVLSANLMVFVDRIILAGYSSNAMYAAIISGNFVAVFVWVFVGIASTAGVFVGQYNGQNEREKLAAPVWQMIYMSLASSVILVPMGFFSEYINFLPDYVLKDGIDYQRPLFYFGFLPSLIAGLSAFFIGQGKTSIITNITILGNILNAILTYYLVYNLNLGASGASIGTVISQGFQAIVLIITFLSKNNRRSFYTLKNCQFNKKIFTACFKIGVPVSANNFFLILAWYILATISGYASKEMGIIWGFGANIYNITIFFAEGLGKSITAIISNMIGRQDIESIKKVYKRFVIIVAIFICVVLMPSMVLFPNIAFKVLNIVRNEVEGIYSQLVTVLKLSFFMLCFESFEYVTWGILTSGGDTRYPAIVSQVCLWGLIVIPVYVLYSLSKLSSINTIYSFCVLSYAISSFIIYKRYRSMRWYERLNV
ncbi:MAG: polysaccharide biosynthesis C-terminal domain-containing protein [Holosporales bacterium]|jgi:MATE family multidrug resistance protein|nr:polysaccharide biosynthesis C-terminal domain-containing protein [Holosporales bacterium]